MADFDFRAELMPADEIVAKLNKGARDTNMFNSLKYLEKIIEYKGFGTGLGNQITITIPGLTSGTEELPFEIDETQVMDTREDVDKFLFGEEDE